MAFPDADTIYRVARGTLELLHFAAGIGVLVVAYKALEQLKIAKNDIARRVQREAAQATREQLETWSTEIIPALREVIALEDNLGLAHLSCSMECFDDEEIRKSPPPVVEHGQKMWALIDKQPEYCDKLLQSCNQIEASAMSFMTGIANEEIAFLPLSESYCEFVERTYPLYCHMRRRGQLNRWEYTVQLYKVWSQRRKKHDLDATHERLTSERDKATKASKPIRPMGAEDGR